MVERNFSDWNGENLRKLRMSMGWSKSDLARHLQCRSEDVIMWELGERRIEVSFIGDLERLLLQAEVLREEVRVTPIAEQQCETNALEQIEFSRVKEDLE